MKFETAEDLIRRYKKLLEQLSLKANNYVELEAERCVKCGGRKTQRGSEGKARKVGRRVLSDVCDSCGEAWEGESYRIMRGEVKKYGSPRDAERRLAQVVSEIAPLRPIIETFPQGEKGWTHELWNFSAICALQFYESNIGSDANVVDWGRKNCASFGPWWEVKKVRDARKRYVSKVESRARRERLLYSVDGRRRFA